MKRYYFVLLAAIFLIAMVNSNLALIRRRNVDCSQKKYRLSGDFLPSFYSLQIHPDIDKETFEGEVLIHVRNHFSVNYIEFHSSKLNIDQVYFDSKKAIYTFDRDFCNLERNELGYEFLEDDLIRIRYCKNYMIPPGPHIVQIKYNGEFTKVMQGIFKAGFSKNGTLYSHMIATEFQPTSARKVFPCFDEPDFKAKFQLSLVVPNNTYTALSNMKAIDIFETSNGIVYKFAVTPPMSTYLLSFVISQHDCKEYIDKIPYRVCLFNASQENNTRFLKFASEIIKFYEEYTNITYTLPKVDFVYFDRNNQSLASENWGLVTVNSSLLSSDNDFFADSQKFNVITHELAHFWFGNLVTNEWWDGLWLQEGLATFMSIKAEKHILKNEESKYFLQTYMEYLLWEERNRNLTPIVTCEEHPKKIFERFNEVTYYKAASILRMLEFITGEELFQKALMKYLHQFSFNTANTNDFLSIIESFTREINIREFMESFLYQNGYPIIHVYEEKNAFVLKPQNCCQQNNESSFDNITKEQYNMDQIELSTNIGYYRVNYSLDLWERFIEDDRELEHFERNALLMEGAYLFESDLISCDIVLKHLAPHHFAVNSACVAFIILSGKINHDKEAEHYLKDFFIRIVEMSRIKEFIDYFLKYCNRTDSDDETDKENKQVTQQTEDCIKWLKNESKNYLDDLFFVLDV